MNMKIISYEDICRLNITPIQCFEWAEEAIKSKKQSILPPKISMKPYEGAFCNVMPCMMLDCDDRSIGGTKIVTRYKDRVPSLESRIVLMDSNNGSFLAFMDGTWITTMRTGAVAAHSILLLSKDNFSTIGIMGLGNVARATLLILAEKIENRKLTIKLLKYKKQEIDFANRFQNYKNLTFIFADSVEDIVLDSDVVISGATYLSDDVCGDDCFKEGVVVVPIHTRGFSNCDLFFDKVYVDDIGHVRHFKNFNEFKTISEITDVANGKSVGRENDKERILVYNIGISIQDIYFASKIYQLLTEREMINILPEIEMYEPEDKFWV